MSSYDPRLIPFTGGHEGFVSRWYRDPTGTPTIGYGFTWKSRVFSDWWQKQHGRKFRPGDIISKPDAAAILTLLIDAEYAPPVTSRISDAKASVSPHALAAAIDMSYNCGPGALRWKWFTSLLRGRISEAANRYRVTATTSRGRRLPGLVRRRKEGAAILQDNRWPADIMAPKNPKATGAVLRTMPVWQIGPDDFTQGLKWLKELGLYSGTTAAGRKDAAVGKAVLAFQQQHKQLNNDGVLGRATLDQIQRVVDLKRKAAQSAATGAGGAVAGTSGDALTQAAGFDWLLWGSLGFVAAAAAWLAWHYRDEIGIAARSLFGKA